MTDIIINAPHLLNWRQRLGAVLLNGSGWLLWCYFFAPLLSLGCWLLHHSECAQWVNWSGGYLTVQDVLRWYVEIVVGMALVWLIWLSYRFAVKRHRQALPPVQPVSPATLCATFTVSPNDLQACLNTRLAVVHFDRSGQIIGLEACGLSALNLPKNSEYIT
ncbi:MAG: poly-beta-1,6-N-acetyl-D-glucosamine biosynthesis protein PgaD [Candidatus Methylumidiphilus sp.]